MTIKIAVVLLLFYFALCMSTAADGRYVWTMYFAGALIINTAAFLMMVGAAKP